MSGAAPAAGRDHGSPKNSVAKMLVDADFTNVFTFPPWAADAPEAIVLSEGAFEREARADDGERGSVAVAVRVVREGAADAEAAALACERAVRRAAWEPYALAGSYRIRGVDTTAPALELRDGSGRWVWAFAVTLSVTRAT